MGYGRSVEMKSGKVVGVIPSRWGSTRFPGKSLALIAGKPLVVRVLERVRLAKRLDEVWVATDDERIRAAVEAAGGKAVMTKPDHPSGTDRIAEAVAGTDAEVVLNIQGDEPLIDPGLIDAVAESLSGEGGWDMATAATPIRSARELESPDVVKVVTDGAGGALYFSRSPIPHVRGAAAGSGPVEGAHWRHVGLYGYKRAFLEKMVRTPVCELERLEKLEQLRALWLGGKIRVRCCEESGVGVDRPEDVARVEAMLREGR